MAALTWTTLRTVLQAIIARTPYPYVVSDGAFNTLYPAATSYAEEYIYNKIPMLAQRRQDTSLSTTAGSRSISLDGTALPIVVPQRVALIVSSGSQNLTDTAGNLLTDTAGNVLFGTGGVSQVIQYLPTSLDFIDIFWPNQSQVWAPASALATYWCLEGGVAGDFISPTVIIAPTPDQVYKVVLTGLFQQTPISQTNPQTYLSTLYPELMVACCMVFLSGALLRNYSSAGGAQPDEPGMPIHWQQQVDRLIGFAQAEEGRRRGQGSDWLDRLSAAPAPAGRPPA